jgi:hypothetical protein
MTVIEDKILRNFERCLIKSVLIRVHQGGCRWGVAPLEKSFGKNLKGGTKVKFTPSPFF